LVLKLTEDAHACANMTITRTIKSIFS